MFKALTEYPAITRRSRKWWLMFHSELHFEFLDISLFFLHNKNAYFSMCIYKSDPPLDNSIHPWKIILLSTYVCRHRYLVHKVYSSDLFNFSISILFIFFNVISIIAKSSSSLITKFTLVFGPVINIE